MTLVNTQFREVLLDYTDANQMHRRSLETCFKFIQFHGHRENIKGLGYGVKGLGFRDWGSGLMDWGSTIRDWGSCLRDFGSVMGVQGLVSRAQLGFIRGTSQLVVISAGAYSAPRFVFFLFTRKPRVE